MIIKNPYFLLSISTTFIYSSVLIILFLFFIIFLFVRYKRNKVKEKINSFLNNLNALMEKYYRDIALNAKAEPFDYNKITDLMSILNKSLFCKDYKKNIDRLITYLDKNGYSVEILDKEYETGGKNLNIPSFQIKTKSLNQIYVRSFQEFIRKTKSVGPTVVDVTPVTYEALFNDLRYFGEEFRPADPTYKQPVLFDLDKILFDLPENIVLSKINSFLTIYKESIKKHIADLYKDKTLNFITISKIFDGKKLWLSPFDGIENGDIEMEKSNIVFKSLFRDAVYVFLQNVFEECLVVDKNFKISKNIVLNRPIEETLENFFTHISSDNVVYRFYGKNIITTTGKFVDFILAKCLNKNILTRESDFLNTKISFEYILSDEIISEPLFFNVLFKIDNNNYLINISKLLKEIDEFSETKTNQLIEREISLFGNANNVKEALINDSVLFSVIDSFLNQKYEKYYPNLSDVMHIYISLYLRALYTGVLAYGEAQYMIINLISNEYDNHLFKNPLSEIILELSRKFSLQQKNKLFLLLSPLSEIDKEKIKTISLSIFNDTINAIDILIDENINSYDKNRLSHENG